MPNIRTAIENAIGLEVHSNRYYFDYDTTNFAELIGGYVDGDYFVPVRFGIKMSDTGRNSIYVVVSQDKIKKSKVIKPNGVQNQSSVLYGSRLLTVSIPQVLENVNSPDIIRCIPDGFLSEDKRKIKYASIAETIQRMVDRAAKELKADVFAATDVPTYSIRRGAKPKKTIKANIKNCG